VALEAATCAGSEGRGVGDDRVLLYYILVLVCIVTGCMMMRADGVHLEDKYTA
jgi:hypothetical protein